jgi:hypothetical protein
MVTLAQLESSIDSAVSFAADLGFVVLFTVATGILIYLVLVTFTVDELQSYFDAAVLFVEEWGVRILVAGMLVIVINLAFRTVVSMHHRMLAASCFCRWAVDVWSSVFDGEQLLALRSEVTGGLIGCFRLFLLVVGFCVLMPLGVLLYSFGVITRLDALVNWTSTRTRTFEHGRDVMSDTDESVNEVEKLRRVQRKLARKVLIS